MISSRLGLRTFPRGGSSIHTSMTSKFNRFFAARNPPFTSGNTKYSNRFLGTYKGNGVIGIVREEGVSYWERRAPLCPEQVRQLVKVEGFRVLVQPCSKRVFTDKDYIEAGAEITPNLDEACLLVGVKKMSLDKIKEGKSYMFFAHVIKAQPANMGLLDHLLEKKARLFDYECITKGGLDDTPRLVAFGKYAGMAGMIDAFQGLGVRLLAEGQSSAFLNLPMSYQHDSLTTVYSNLAKIGKEIERNGGATGSSCNDPLIFAFTGTGNVSKGAREIFDKLPHEYVTVEELPRIRADVKAGIRSAKKLYAVVVTAKDMVRLKSNGQTRDASNQQFDKTHYYQKPELYEDVFHEKIAPHITVLVNGMYWDQKYPRLLTKEQIKKLRSNGNHSLKMVADITCDVGGSVEFLNKSTTIEKPFFTYVPETDSSSDGIETNGIVMLGVDILPSELPRDASEHFGKALMPLIPPLLKSKGGSIDDLPAELRRACITADGVLLPKWTYISRLRGSSNILPSPSSSASTAGTSRDQHSSTSRAVEVDANSKTVLTHVEMRGHLFDSGLINHVLDLLERGNVDFTIRNLSVRPNTTSGAVPSHLLFSVSGTETAVGQVIEDINKATKKNAAAHGSMKTMHHQRDADATIVVKPQRRVLLFGSGRVAAPVMRLFDMHDNIHVTIATDQEQQARELMQCIGEGRATFVNYTHPRDNHLLPRLFKDCDLAISLLPANLHIPLAKEAIQQRRHLVTASYVSPDMRALHEEAKAQGVILMNEVGLDPGIDHMLIMQAVDSIHQRGGVVTELVSLCGGLPDPAAADNPLRYKISWSPRGALLASTNNARYLKDNKIIEVPGADLLRSTQSSERFPTMRLEVVPNRDSLTYRDLYNVPKVASICRGTLRYEGWANVMQALKVLNLLDTMPTKFSTWTELLLGRPLKEWENQMGLSKDMGGRGRNIAIANAIEKRLVENGTVADVQAAMTALHWLGLCGEGSAENLSLPAASPIDCLAKLLEEKLVYAPGEKDMVAMFHSIVGTFPDGRKETHTSRLLAFGTVGGDSAMSATVGYTTAAAAELILEGKIKPQTHGGVQIPTDKAIYIPLLQRLKEFGITWSESESISNK